VDFQLAAWKPPTHILPLEQAAMNKVVRIVKRGSKESVDPISEPKIAQHSTTEIVRTVKAWITESRERRSAVAIYPLWLREAREGLRS